MTEIKSSFGGSKLELPVSNAEFSGQFLELYDQFNCNPFKPEIICPSGLENVSRLVLDAFNSGSSIRTLNTGFPNVDVSKFDSKKVLLGFSCGLDSVAQAVYLKEAGFDVTLFYVKNVNTYENGQANKRLVPLADKLGLPYVEANIRKNMLKSNPYRQAWPENPLKNQLILSCMLDWCLENGCKNLSMGDDFDLGLDKAVPGINLTDAREITEAWLEFAKSRCRGLNFMKIDSTVHNKEDRIRTLMREGLQDEYYSCVLPGKFNQMRHNSNEKKFGLSLFAYSCGSSCRKCAMHCLIMHYSGMKSFPDNFIDACWRRMWDNAHSADYEFFRPDLPLEARIKNLFEY